MEISKHMLHVYASESVVEYAGTSIYGLVKLRGVLAQELLTCYGNHKNMKEPNELLRNMIFNLIVNLNDHIARALGLSWGTPPSNPLGIDMSQELTREQLAALYPQIDTGPIDSNPVQGNSEKE